MLNFCTLFDSNYLAKGLVMYQSLKNACQDFHLFIFSFDEKAHSILSDLQLDNVTLISLSEFEDIELLSVKASRTKAEYCWTSTPSVILYCLKNYNLDHCTYIDSDLFFFDNPMLLIDEMGNHDVLITDHRYTTEYDQSDLSGKYCVQFMCFKSTDNGLKILKWWRNACIDWCYNRREEGKFGDQKYLDDWLVRFTGVHELVNLGGGVAPWNVQQYEIRVEDSVSFGIEKSTQMKFKLVFYHFHHLHNKKFNFVNEFNLGPYKLSTNVIRLIYKPYMHQLKAIDKYIMSLNKGIDCLGSEYVRLPHLKLIAHILKNTLRKNKIIWIRKWLN